MPHSNLDDILQGMRLELRRGCLTLALAERGLDIDEGTLYPLIRRLETQGLLSSEWREENKRRKRFYRLSAGGEIILQKLLDELRAINASLQSILQEA
jgi:PadR family transcriptional regulator PadR